MFQFTLCISVSLGIKRILAKDLKWEKKKIQQIMEDKILVIGKRLLGDSDDADKEAGGREGYILFLAFWDLKNTVAHISSLYSHNKPQRSAICPFQNIKTDSGFQFS